MENIKVDENSLYTINSDIVAKYVGIKTIGRNQKVVMNVKGVSHEIFNGEDLIDADLVDLHLYIIMITGYTNYVICNQYVFIDGDYKACIYKIKENDNTTDSNL